MPGRNKEPIAVIKAKGKKHLTKEEILKREAEELKVPVASSYTAPAYLKTVDLKREYEDIAKKLIELDIFTELDVDCLARYVISKDIYLRYTAQMQKILRSSKKIRSWSVIAGVDDEELKDLLEKIIRKQHGSELYNIQLQQDKAFKQCQVCAKELGLTIVARAKLVIPEPADEDEEL